MSYEYMTGMGTNGFVSTAPRSTPPPPPAGKAPPPPPPPPPTGKVSAPSSSDFVPTTMPRTGIMLVIKNGRKFVLLTRRATAAKMNALLGLGTSEGARLSEGIRRDHMTQEEARLHAGRHYRDFYNGARLTQAEYARVQAALGTLTRASTKYSNIQISTTADVFQETQDAADQTSSISDQANQRIVDLEDELVSWKKAFEEAQAAAQGGTTSEEVAALLDRVTSLAEQLDEARRVAAEADDDAAEAAAAAADAEDQYDEESDEIEPWPIRYKWHIGVSALVVAIAGGAYWMTSRQPVKNTRLPAPASPKHPAGF